MTPHFKATGERQVTLLLMRAVSDLMKCPFLIFTLRNLDAPESACPDWSAFSSLPSFLFTWPVSGMSFPTSGSRGRCVPGGASSTTEVNPALADLLSGCPGPPVFHPFLQQLESRRS